jgi:circadian clock protein KaiB
VPGHRLRQVMGETMNDERKPDRAVRSMLLFVAGGEANSLVALMNFRKLCADTPDYEMRCDVIDVLDNYQKALEYRVLVTPCLVLLDPAPRIMIVGTLKDSASVRSALRLPAEVTVNDA